MKRWKRIVCIAPAVFYLLSLFFAFMPVFPRVWKEGDTIHLTWSNFVYDYHLNSFVSFFLTLSIIMVAMFGVLGAENAWEKAQKHKRWWWR